VTAFVEEAPRRLTSLVQELRKLPAFVRRDFLVALSYRAAFFGDAVGLVFGALVFYYVGMMVDQSKLPSYSGNQPSYIEFVAVGLALGVFIQLGLGKVAEVMGREQVQGTLESLVVTPTAMTTIQIGSVLYDLIYIPIRTAVFLIVIDVAFGLNFYSSGIVPAMLLLIFFIPFVWGLGLVAGAAALTVRRGAGLIGTGVALLTLGSGAYFPLELLPNWVETLSAANPITLAIEGMRNALIGGTGWSGIGRSLAILAPLSLLSLALGLAAFRVAQWRERRRGTLGLY
jgi:ABC-2 type transport system permease protein